MDSTQSLFLLIGIAPVLCFLGALHAFDSFKIVRLRSVILLVGAAHSLPVRAMLQMRVCCGWSTWTWRDSPGTCRR
jgi:hypothetical protein